jgi:hypothetical protein
LGHDRANNPVGGLDGIHPLFQQQGDVGLAAHQRQPALVFVNLRGIGRAIMRALRGLKLGDDVSDARIGRQIDAAIKPDPHLGAVIATQHGPVLQQGHPETEAGRRQCGGCPGNAPANDYQVVASAVLGRFRQTERLASESG